MKVSVDKTITELLLMNNEENNTILDVIIFINQMASTTLLSVNKKGQHGQW